MSVISFSQKQLTDFFSEILHEVRRSEGSKTDRVEVFRKVLMLGEKAQNSLKIVFWLLPKI